MGHLDELVPGASLKLSATVETILRSEFDSAFSDPAHKARFLKEMEQTVEALDKRKASPLKVAAFSVRNYFTALFLEVAPMLLRGGSRELDHFAGLADAYGGIAGQTTILLLAEEHLGGWANQVITDKLKDLSPEVADAQTIATQADIYRNFMGRSRRYGELLSIDRSGAKVFEEYRRVAESDETTFKKENQEIRACQMRECVLAGSRVAEYAFRRFILRAS